MNLHAAITVLNQALAADPEAMKLLLGNRVDCNEQLAVHPTIQVQQEEGKRRYKVGALGLINGLIEAMTGHRIAVMIDKQSGRIAGFQARPHGTFTVKH